MIRVCNPFLEFLQYLHELFHGATVLFEFRECDCMCTQMTLRLAPLNQDRSTCHLYTLISQQTTVANQMLMEFCSYVAFKELPR